MQQTNNNNSSHFINYSVNLAEDVFNSKELENNKCPICWGNFNVEDIDETGKKIELIYKKIVISHKLNNKNFEHPIHYKCLEEHWNSLALTHTDKTDEEKKDLLNETKDTCISCQKKRYEFSKKDVSNYSPKVLQELFSGTSTYTNQELLKLSLCKSFDEFLVVWKSSVLTTAEQLYVIEKYKELADQENPDTKKVISYLKLVEKTILSEKNSNSFSHIKSQLHDVGVHTRRFYHSHKDAMNITMATLFLLSAPYALSYSDMLK